MHLLINLTLLTQILIDPGIGNRSFQKCRSIPGQYQINQKETRQMHVTYKKKYSTLHAS